MKAIALNGSARGNRGVTCMHKMPGSCAIKDDMDRIYPHFKESDIFVMATPVYVDTMSAQMKAVMDRCICCLEPFLRIDVRRPCATPL